MQNAKIQKLCGAQNLLRCNIWKIIPLRNLKNRRRTLKTLKIAVKTFSKNLENAVRIPNKFYLKIRQNLQYWTKRLKPNFF